VNIAMAKVGRPRKNYKTTWGEIINGLRKRTDGRWHDIEDDYIFAGAAVSKREAIRMFRQRKGLREIIPAENVPQERPAIADEYMGNILVKLPITPTIHGIPENVLFC